MTAVAAINLQDMSELPRVLAHELFDLEPTTLALSSFRIFGGVERQMGATDEFPTAQYVFMKMFNLSVHLSRMGVEKSPPDVLNTLYFAAATIAGYKCARLTARMDDFPAARNTVCRINEAIAIVCERRLVSGHARPRGGWNEITLGPWKSHLLDAKHEVMYDFGVADRVPTPNDEPPPERWCLRMDSRLEWICKTVETWPAPQY